MGNQSQIVQHLSGKGRTVSKTVVVPNNKNKITHEYCVQNHHLLFLDLLLVYFRVHNTIVIFCLQLDNKDSLYFLT